MTTACLKCLVFFRNMKIDLYTRTGGYKTVRNTDIGKDIIQAYTGQDAIFSLNVTFDLQRPEHCKEKGTCSSQTAEDVSEPVFLFPDASKVRAFLMSAI